jgi:hypothetical protein
MRCSARVTGKAPGRTRSILEKTRRTGPGALSLPRMGPPLPRPGIGKFHQRNYASKEEADRNHPLFRVAYCAFLAAFCLIPGALSLLPVPCCLPLICIRRHIHAPVALLFCLCSRRNPGSSALKGQEYPPSPYVVPIGLGMQSSTNGFCKLQELL